MTCRRSYDKHKCFHTIVAASYQAVDEKNVEACHLDVVSDCAACACVDRHVATSHTKRSVSTPVQPAFCLGLETVGYPHYMQVKRYDIVTALELAALSCKTHVA